MELRKQIVGEPPDNGKRLAADVKRWLVTYQIQG
jgi:hypothetical protein